MVTAAIHTSAEGNEETCLQRLAARSTQARCYSKKRAIVTVKETCFVQPFIVFLSAKREPGTVPGSPALPARPRWPRWYTAEPEAALCCQHSPLSPASTASLRYAWGWKPPDLEPLFQLFIVTYLPPPSTWGSRRRCFVSTAWRNCSYLLDNW